MKSGHDHGTSGTLASVPVKLEHHLKRRSDLIGGSRHDLAVAQRHQSRRPSWLRRVGLVCGTVQKDFLGAKAPPAAPPPKIPISHAPLLGRVFPFLSTVTLTVPPLNVGGAFAPPKLIPVAIAGLPACSAHPLNPLDAVHDRDGETKDEIRGDAVHLAWDELRAAVIVEVVILILWRSAVPKSPTEICLLSTPRAKRRP